MKNNLTAIILTKNEEYNIKKCLKNLKQFCDEIIVVDSYSTDKTKEICSAENVTFVEHQFINHSQQFNWALDNLNIESEWIIRVDADEEFTDELIEEISSKINNIDDNVNGIILKRRVYFMGRWIKHGGIYPLYILRIFRKGTAYSENREMDEHIVLKSGETLIFEHDFIDNNYKMLTDWIEKHNWYSTKEVNAYFNKKECNKELSSKQSLIRRWIKNNIFYKIPLFTRARLYFNYRYYIKLGFLDGEEGKIFHFLQAYWYRFLIDAKIYEAINKDDKR